MLRSPQTYCVVVMCIWHLAVCGFTVPCLAQQALFKHESYGIREGLSQGYISSIIQDDDGFLWIGTKNGLNRYDGKQFKHFRNDPFDENSISDDYITDIFPYGSYLVLGTASGGINIFNRYNFGVIRLPYGTKESPDAIAKAIRKVVVDKSGDIWFLNQEKILAGHVFKIALKKGFWENRTNRDLSQHIESMTQFSTTKSRSLFINRHFDQIYFESPSMLYTYRVGIGPVISIPTPTKFHFKGFLQSDDGGVWVNAEGGFYYLNRDDLTYYPSDISHKYALGIDKEGFFIVLNNDNNISQYAFDAENGIMRHKKVISDLGIEVTTAFVDATNNLWMGTGGYGLTKVSSFEPFIEHLFNGISVYSTPYYNERKQEFTFFTDPGGLVSSVNNPSFPRGIFEWNLDNSNASHTRLLVGRDSSDWFMYHTSITDRHYLLELDKSGNLLKKIDPDLKIERPGNLQWYDDDRIVLAIGGIMAIVNPKNDQIQKFQYDTILSIGHDVRSIATTKGGIIWLGTSQGLIKAIPTAGKFVFEYIGKESSKLGLLSNDIGCLFVDPSLPDELWIGTKGKGLHLLNTNTKSFTYYLLSDGLPDEVIYGILPESSKILWLSTNKGLVRFSKDTKKMRIFTPEDGLQDYEFNTWAYSKPNDKMLLFGGVNGLNVIFLERIIENKNPPKPVLSSMMVNNRLIRPGDASGILQLGLAYTRSIHLKYNQNSIELRLGALEFTHPSSNRFQFYLEGIELPWVHDQVEPIVQYLNLAPGKYKFHYRAVNSDGYSSLENNYLLIQIDPPWYKSLWAYCLYIILFLSFILFYIRIRVNQVKLQGKLLIEQAQKDKIGKIEAFKSKFYRNITHEFRTPLTLIKGVSNQLLDRLNDRPEQLVNGTTNLKRETLQNDLTMIDRNSDRLLNLVNELLELAKSEDETLSLNLEYGNMMVVIESILQSFQSKAQEKQIEILKKFDCGDGIYFFDCNKLEHIFENLLSNAVKYSPAKSTIQVEALVFEREEKLIFRIIVRDEGPGIPQDELEKVFHPFYRINSNSGTEPGSGIGLSYCSDLVRFMNGKIWAENRPSRGCKFTAEWPIDQDISIDYELSDDQNLARQANWETPLISLRHELEQQNEEEVPLLLIVEDNEDIRTFVKSIFASKYQIIEAEDGQLGLDKAFNSIPDIIISDVMMPHLDGQAMSKILKSDMRTDHIPIIFLTAKTSIEHRVMGYSLGVDVYLTKPFIPSELESIVTGLLENRRRVQQYIQRKFNFSSVLGDSTHADNESDSIAALPVRSIFLDNLNALIEDSYSDDQLNVDTLASAMNMSRSNLHRKLKSLSGISTTNYINQFRINKSLELLQNKDLSISEVAYQVGYTDPKYFTRLFAQQIGTSPVSYRQNLVE